MARAYSLEQQNGDGQYKPNVRRKKEGAKWIGRPAGNTVFWDDDEKYQKRQAFDELDENSSRF